MARIELKGVSKVYSGRVVGLQPTDLDVADGELLVLVGPSGCGKSTTLRIVAGLEYPTAGSVYIGEQEVNQIAPKDRDVAMVFQNYALYPHMTVYKNLSFGLLMRRKFSAWDYPWWFFLAPQKFRQAKAERRAIDQRVRQTAAMLGIEHLLARRPHALSGGQMQRVAVGRAIVRTPKVFLFDEPLSNLDTHLRLEMRAELKRLHRQLKTTTIYVTHDQEEAMTLGDRVVVMNAGAIQQIGTPHEIFHSPANRFVASFFGTPPMNFLEGHLRVDGRLACFDHGECRINLPPAVLSRVATYRDQTVTVGFRPDTLIPVDQPLTNQTLSGEIELIEPVGQQMDVHMKMTWGQRLVSRCQENSSFLVGRRIHLQIQSHRLHLFEPGVFGRKIPME